MTIRASLRPVALGPIIALAGGLVVASGVPITLDTLIDAATGVVIGVAGLVVWNRRPAWRTGPLLLIAAALWYVGSLYLIAGQSTIVPFLGFTFRGYYDVILAFVVLTVPGDRFRDRTDRAVVGLLLTAMVVRSVWRLVGMQPGVGTGNAPDAPPNPLLLVSDISQFIAVDVLLSAIVGLGLWLVAAAAVRRFAERGGPRRVRDPILVGGAAWATLAGLYAVSGLARREAGIEIVPESGPIWVAQYAIRIIAPIALLLGLARLRSISSAAVALLASDRRPARTGELEAALREALGDPAVALLSRTSDGAWRTPAGEATDLPGPDGGRAVTFLEFDGGVTGAVVHDDALLDDPDVLRTVTAVVELAVANERLQEVLRNQLQEVRASRSRIVEAADAERRRVERDLHDGAQQRLVALALSLRTIRTRLGPTVPETVAAELDAAAEEVRAAIAELRELAQGLDPAILREAGLAAAVRSLADRSPVPVRLEVEVEGRLPSRVETAAYFVASEALTNVAKHARASGAMVRICRVDDHLELEIADDGIGGASPDGAGLRGLIDRIAAVDGTFALSAPPGAGTRITVTIPCAS